MTFPIEFTWVESYLNNDRLWIDDVLNWEDAIDVTMADFTLYGFLMTPFFPASYFFLDAHVKLSFLDILFLVDFNKKNFSREFFDLFMWDLLFVLNTKFLPAQFFFYSDYQDVIITLLYYSPELVMALNDYVNFYWIHRVFAYTPTTVFDLFNDSITASIAQFTDFWIFFFLFIWVVVLFVNLFSLLKWNNPLEVYFVRFFNYLYNIAKDSRVQFESFLQTVFFFIFYWSMLIATFDDDQEELIEIFDNGFFFFFLPINRVFII